MPLLTKASLSSVLDIREVSKRLFIIYAAALLAGLLLAIYFFFLNLYVSAETTAAFAVAMGVVIFLKQKGILNKIEFYFFFIVSIHLMVSALVEGVKCGQYFYYFPMLIGMPVIVDFQKSKYKILLFHSVITIISFLICIFIDLRTSPIELIPEEVSAKIFMFNSTASVLMTAAFSIAFIYFQKLNFEDLIEQKNNTISSRTRFLSTMGHELRTPLNGVLGAVNLLKEEKYLSEENEYFRILKYCSRHMLNLVNDILDFNKIEAGKLEVFLVEMNLKQLIANATLPFYNSFEERNLQLLVHVDTELDNLVLGDDMRIIQLLNNLLSNALKFTEKGYVKLSVLCKKKDDGEIRAEFIVEDTGLGIAKEDQAKIFESFWQVIDTSTRKFTGTGLGLSICIRLLELMNSSLKLESEKGKGSAFSFEIDFKRVAKVQEPLPGKKTDSEDLEGLRILVVEDNMINMMIAKKILAGFKATISSAFNGKEALDILEADANYSLILMDLEMPVMNGFTAIAHVKKLYPTIPVIAFTASLIDQEMLAELLATGFSDFIPKPFEPQQIFSTVKKHAILTVESLA